LGFLLKKVEALPDSQESNIEADEWYKVCHLGDSEMTAVSPKDLDGRFQGRF
jgi:hypothetical protein